MSKEAEKLVNNAEKTKVGVPMDTAGLIKQLVNDKKIAFEQARTEIVEAIAKSLKDRPPTVSEIVRKAIVDGTGKPKREDLKFTNRD